MSDAHGAVRVRVPVWFWIVAGLAVLWNFMGVFDYVMTQTRNDAYLTSFTDEQLAYFTSFPAWYVAIWASAVFAAFISSVLLLLRMKIAAAGFAVSTALFLVSSVYAFGFTPAMEMMGAGGLAFSAVIFASLAALWWFSRWCAERGILK
ncbi:hypothetical protein DDZ18_01355 [Marinicauda salina]|uniref:Sugar transporter n=1 Tax=Marinicauda salina TaxID=2135793 RepID=A0A2U2BW87_9PROT|nr:hypothetical protein [Marinicauda salina]PWE18283.1 hypothetical protein DDZ18_01355 [Marinicauda salina]